MWLKPFGHQKTRKKRPSFSALGKTKQPWARCLTMRPWAMCLRRCSQWPCGASKRSSGPNLLIILCLFPLGPLVVFDPWSSILFGEYAGNTSMFWHVLAPNFTPSHIIKIHRTSTPLEREIECIEGLRQFSQKPPVEVSGRVSVLTPTTASRARFHEQLWQCFVDQTWPDKDRLSWWFDVLFPGKSTRNIQKWQVYRDYHHTLRYYVYIFVGHLKQSQQELVVVETYTHNQRPSEVFTKLVKAGEKRLKYLAIEVDENGDFTVGAKRNLTVLMSSGQYAMDLLSRWWGFPHFFNGKSTAWGIYRWYPLVN